MEAMGKKGKAAAKAAGEKVLLGAVLRSNTGAIEEGAEATGAEPLVLAVGKETPSDIVKAKSTNARTFILIHSPSQGGC